VLRFLRCISFGKEESGDTVILPGDVTWKYNGERWAKVPDLNNPPIIIAADQTEVRDRAYVGSTATRITFEQGYLRRIGCESFRNSNLEAITIPESVTHIETRAFAHPYVPEFNKWGDLLEINLNSGLKVIEPEAFAGSAVIDLTIPGTVESIGYAAFGDCRHLRTVYFEAVESELFIDNQAFGGCNRLHSLCFMGGDIVFTPGSLHVATRTDSMYVSLPSYGNLYIENNSGKTQVNTNDPGSIVNFLHEIFCTAQQGDNVDFRNSSWEYDGKEWYKCPVKPHYPWNEPSNNPIIIGKGVTEIADGAFAGSKATAVTFEEGSTLRRIGAEAFRGVPPQHPTHLKNSHNWCTKQVPTNIPFIALNPR
jgi:hypothetical protein